MRSKEKSKQYYDKSSNSVNFNVGDKVLLTNELKSRDKFDPPWLGPYEVIEIISNENTKIKIKNKHKIVHNKRLKLFIS